jgi:nitronate monooxygenase
VGADLAYIGTRFTASKEANASEGNKQCIIDSSGEEIVYTNLFTGVHGNYLKRSIAAAGLDPDDLPVADKSKMNFGSGGNTKAKAWRDIWGSGQGIGQIADAPPVAELVERLKQEFAEASGDFLKRARA